MTEREKPITRLDRETYKLVGITLKGLALELGAKNLLDPNETVLFTRELGLSADLTIVADSRSDHSFAAILDGHYLPSSSKIFGEGYTLFQLNGGNLSKDLMRRSLSRLPNYGKAIIWDENVSLEKALSALEEINEKREKFIRQRPTFFFPKKYLVKEEFTNRDSVFLWPRDVSADKAREMFDQPHSFAYWCYADTSEMIGFVLDSQREYFNRKEIVTHQVLKEWGISPKLMSRISEEKASRIFDKVQTEVARRLGEAGNVVL